MPDGVKRAYPVDSLSLPNAVPAAARNLLPDESTDASEKAPVEASESASSTRAADTDAPEPEADDAARPVTSDSPARTEQAPPAEKDENAVSRTIDELLELSNANQELRDTLCARGVPRRMIQQMVEIGMQKQSDRQSALLDAALEKAASENGEGAIDRQTLEDGIAELVRIEQDVGHVRQLARGMGLDPRSLTILSQLIQSNPGDRGEAAVNTFLAYARACDIPLEGVAVIAADLTAKPTSVLPNIPRELDDLSAGARRRNLFRDVLLGLLIAVVTIGLLV